MIFRILAGVAAASVAGAAAASTQACPSGRPSRQVTRSTWVEPYAPALALKGMFEALPALGYSIVGADSGARRVVTEPRYRWPATVDTMAWRDRTHPGLVVMAAVDTVAAWSSITLEVKALCETGEPVPPGWGPQLTVEGFVVATAFTEVRNRWGNSFEDERLEVPGPRCAPLQNGDRKLRICRDIVRARPEDAQAQLDHALALIRFFRARAAREPASRAIALSGHQRAIYDSLCSALLVEGEHGEAARLYTGALERWPDDGPIHRALGAALAGQRRYNEALPHFKRAIELVPGDYAAHYHAAVVLDALKRPEEGIPHCAAARPHQLASLRERPESWDAWIALGRCAAMGGRHTEAVSYFERASQISIARIRADAELVKVINRSLKIAGPQDAAPLPGPSL